MTVTAECPACGRPQVHGILDHTCTSALERDLGDVPAIVDELHTTLARQARIAVAGRSTAPARERWAYHPGASATLDDLTNVLTTWARDIRPDAAGKGHPAVVAARVLLASIDDIRAHPAAAELVDEVHNAVSTAWHTVDRPADRQFVGPCLHDEAGVVCEEDLYVRHGAELIRCRVCTTEHDVTARRASLLEQASDMIVTPREASQYVGEIGGIPIGHQRIRNYLDRGRIAERPSPDGVKRLRLGDLLAVLVEHAARHDVWAS